MSCVRGPVSGSGPGGSGVVGVPPGGLCSVVVRPRGIGCICSGPSGPVFSVGGSGGNLPQGPPQGNVSQSYFPGYRGAYSVASYTAVAGVTEYGNSPVTAGAAV